MDCSHSGTSHREPSWASSVCCGASSATPSKTGLIPVNPIHPHRHRGTRAFRIHHEMLWATPEEILRGAHQAERFHNRTSALLIITAAWTGCRWGELAALQRHNTHPDDRSIVVEPDFGALKETAHRQWLGPPKTPASARTVTLPAFLAVLLKHHLASHDHPAVFANVRTLVRISVLNRLINEYRYAA